MSNFPPPSSDPGSQPPGYGGDDQQYGQRGQPGDQPPSYQQAPPGYQQQPPPGGGPGYGQGYAMVPVGQVPQKLESPFYGTGIVILLSIVTCGIWTIVWSYRTGEDLKKYNGDGLGGAISLVVALVLNIVLMFTIPNEIEKMYQRDGRQSPVSTLWGLWFLLPLIGNIIWYVKVQNALNEFWLSKGTQPN